MEQLKNILQTNDRVPKEYRDKYNIDQIREHLILLENYKISNQHIINLKSLLFKNQKTITKIEKVEQVHTLDLEINDSSHSYWANGVPVHNTVNLPSEYPYEDFKRLYSTLYKTGTVKGCTTYRAGTMTEVLASVTKQDESSESVDKIQKTTAPKRPKSLECDIHHVTAEGIKWMVIVGLLNGEPYEVFAFLPKSIHLPSKIKAGVLTKVKKGRYDLECEGIIIENVRDHFETSEQEALTRIISTALRHGTDVEFIVDQLQKSEGTIISFSKAIGRSLKKYITEQKLEKTCDNCSSKNVALQEGCFVCMDCASSKCS